MASIIFWNVNKQDLTNRVCELVKSNDADVLVLNENKAPLQDTLLALQKEVDPNFYSPVSSANTENRFHFFCRDDSLDISEIHNDDRVSVRSYMHGGEQILLATVHGLDMKNHELSERQEAAGLIVKEIEFAKRQQVTDRVLIVGDFNLNPYDRAMNQASNYNAVMTKNAGIKGARKVSGKKYPLYYNPMWNLFGDQTPGPAGTIYDTTNFGPYGWSMFDQVLVSYSILEIFKDVEIPTKAGNLELKTKNGFPDKKNASNHFPVLITLSD